MLPRVGRRCQGRGSPCSSPQGALWDARLPGAGGVGPQGTRSALRHLGPGLHRVSGELGGAGGVLGFLLSSQTPPQVRGADGGAPVRSGAPAGAVPADPGGAIPAVPPPLTPRLRPPSPRAGPRARGTAQSAGHTGPRLLHPGVGLAGGGERDTARGDTGGHQLSLLRASHQPRCHPVPAARRPSSWDTTRWAERCGRLPRRWQGGGHAGSARTHPLPLWSAARCPLPSSRSGRTPARQTSASGNVY